MPYTNLSITYTTVTTLEMQTSIIGVTISKNLQEFLKLDYIDQERGSQIIPNFVTNFLSHNTFKVLKF